MRQQDDKNSQNTPASPPPRSFFRRRDIVIVLVLAALGAGLLFAMRGGLFSSSASPTGSSGGPVAEATIGEQQLMTISLAENRIVHIDDAALPVQLEVRDGAIRFINSVCPDHDCEHFGWLRNEGDWAACLPAKVIVRIP